jgi:hypothetical protein
VENEFVPQLNRVLTNVRSVNKTDVITLLDMFENFAGKGAYSSSILFEGMANACIETLSLLC